MSNLGLILLLICFGAGALIWLGWRGRVLDRHPYCRRCGFDLTGRTPGFPRCTQCGAPLISARSVRRERREVRGWVLFAGAVLMLPALASFITVAWIDAKGKSLREYEPAWMLVNQARSGSKDSRNDALRLLMDRYELGAKTGKPTLTKIQIRSMFDCVLDRQADPDQKWTPALANFFEKGCASGDVTNEQWVRYLQQALGGMVTLHVRGKSAPGHFLPIEITQSKPRIGTFYIYDIDVVGPVTLNPSGQEIAIAYTCALEPSSSRWMIAPSLLVGDDLAQKLKAGPQSIEGNLQIVLRQTLPGAATSRAMVTTRLHGSFELLPPRAKPPSTSTTPAKK